MNNHVWADRVGNRFGGRHGTLPIDDEADGEDLGAEILDSSAEFDGNAGCYAGLEFIGDVGRDPIRGLEFPNGDPGLND